MAEYIDITTTEDPAAPTQGTGGLAEGALNQLLGVGWEDILNTQPTATENLGSAYGAMFQVFNTVSLTASAIMMVYFISIAIMASAHEGVPLGKRYNTLWAPLRIALGVSSVAPVFGGFSVLQGIILAGFIPLSSNLANSVYFALTDYVRTRGVIVANTGVPDYFKTAASKMALMSACAISYSNQVNEEGASYSGNQFWPVEDTDKITLKYFGSPGIFGQGEECGSISFSCGDAPGPTSVGNQYCTVYRNNLTILQANIHSAVGTILSSPNPPSGAIQAAYDTFISNMNTGIAGIRTFAENQQQNLINNDLNLQMQREGWLGAGKWYWYIIGMNNQNEAARNITYQEQPMDDDGNFDADVAAALTKTNAYLIDGGGDTTLGNTMESRGWIYEIAHNISNALSVNTTDVKDPVVILQTMGNAVVNLCTTLVLGSMIGFGIGSIMMPGGVAAKWAANKAVTAVGASGLPGMIGAALTPIFLSGVVLAYYLPSLPYINWTFAQVGWMIMVVETLVAAPLWAAAHIFPEGEGMAGRHAIQGYQLMVNVLLRPTMMVFGMLFAFSVSWICGWLVIDGYQESKDALLTNSHFFADMIGEVVLFVIMVYLLVKVSHMAFGLIPGLTDHVMKWVNFGVTSLGDTTKNAAAGAADAATRAADIGTKSVTSGVGDAASKRQKRLEDAQKSQREADQSSEHAHQPGQAQPSASVANATNAMESAHASQSNRGSGVNSVASNSTRTIGAASSRGGLAEHLHAPRGKV